MANSGKPSGDDRSKLKVWLDGKFVNYADAKVPILTHSLQYGSGIFEGIRAYETDNGTALFRLQDHVKRLFRTAKIYHMDLGYTEKGIEDAIVECVRKNNLKSAYVRPFAFYNSDRIGLGTHGNKVSTFIAAIPFGAYFGKGAETGIRCKTSSWKRINSEILPVEAKASGNYINSLIAHIEATTSGFDEAVMLSDGGRIAEGTAENIFLFMDNMLLTPDYSADILIGITRNSVIDIARAAGIEVVEAELHKEELYTADEVFFTGTAAEVTPIVNIDGVKVGEGKPGPITKMLAQRYRDVTRGKDKAFEGWLTYV
jgi:branched-chain amino acid aminotransferase